MRQITDINELRQIQLAILDKVVEFCDSNNLTYFLSCGSLIGAVRHKGYIPWDDDIDLYMPRPDYNTLLALWDESASYYDLKSHGSKGYIYTYAKLCDRRTLLTEDLVQGFELGVNIDIFPLDFAPDDAKRRERLFWWKKKIFRIRRAKLQNVNFLYSYFNYWCYRHAPVTVPMLDALIRRIFSHTKRSNTVTNLTDANELPRQCIPLRLIQGNPVTVEFEGKHYKTMPGYHEYLTTYYGDYMQLPPEDQRVTHQFKAYWL